MQIKTILTYLLLSACSLSFAGGALKAQGHHDPKAQQMPKVQTKASWGVDIGFGNAFNIPLPVTIRQYGEPDIHFTGHWSTKPFTSPIYMQVRFSRWHNNAAWEFEYIHDKLYLDNKVPNVQMFTITNGYNMFFVNRAWGHKYFNWRLGLGWVFTHPESIIRGKKFQERGGIHWFDTNGYFLSGAVGQIAIEHRQNLFQHLQLFGEAKLTAAYATVPVAAGSADVPNIAFHFIFGMTFNT